MEPFKIEMSNFDGELTLTLKGFITEESEFKYVKMMGINTINMYFQEITGLNSCGIRNWIQWITIMPSKIPMQWHLCPRVVIEQLNMLAGFKPKQATISSFYVPYFCSACDFVSHHLYDLSKTKDIDIADEIPCSKCNKPGEIDILKKKYLAFLTKQ